MYSPNTNVEYWIYPSTNTGRVCRNEDSGTVELAGITRPLRIQLVPILTLSPTKQYSTTLPLPTCILTQQATKVILNTCTILCLVHNIDTIYTACKIDTRIEISSILVSKVGDIPSLPPPKKVTLWSRFH